MWLFKGCESIRHVFWLFPPDFWRGSTAIDNLVVGTPDDTSRSSEMTKLWAMGNDRPRSYVTASQFDVWDLLGLRWREVTRAQLTINLLRFLSYGWKKSFSGFPRGAMLILIFIPTVLMQKEITNTYFLLSSWWRNAIPESFFKH